MFFYKKEMGLESNPHAVIGKSNAIRRVLNQVEHVAPTESIVLITGETGVGKGLIATTIHNLSHRNAGPFIPVNIAALSEELIESELFGHEKGAFTGAIARRKGRFELAHRGTIFLDEIGDLSLALQVKLLRVIEEQRFEPVGSEKTVTSDFRIIAATNRNLEREVAAGRFRQDLFYRLNVFPIQVPPLRERSDDIPLLTTHFIQKLSKKIGKPVKYLPSREMNRLLSYDWPGNVRELEHVIERSIILSDSPIVKIVIPRPPADVSDYSIEGNAIMSLSELEKRHIQKVLAMTGWKVSGKAGAADFLGLHPNTLLTRMQKLGIPRRPDKK
jgi:transcriptional regulator with GAF, ATPase, and Fis domain